jgi:hypothetical protein
MDFEKNSGCLWHVFNIGVLKCWNGTAYIYEFHFHALEPQIWRYQCTNMSMVCFMRFWIKYIFLFTFLELISVSDNFLEHLHLPIYYPAPTRQFIIQHLLANLSSSTYSPIYYPAPTRQFIIQHLLANLLINVTVELHFQKTYFWVVGGRQFSSSNRSSHIWICYS